MEIHVHAWMWLQESQKHGKYRGNIEIIYNGQTVKEDREQQGHFRNISNI